LTTIDEAWELFGRDTTMAETCHVPRSRGTLQLILWIGLQWELNQGFPSNFHPQPVTLSALEEGVTLRWTARETWPSTVGYTVSLHAHSPPLLQQEMKQVRCFAGDAITVTLRLRGITRVFEESGWHRLRVEREDNG
jgi:hypothetical protein